ncbi:MAG TPA: hypothetical protein VJH70_01035 [Candidatus Paceibacterota bacterium]
MNLAQHKWLLWLLFIIVTLPSLIYLGTRITREEGWDNWDFGSAQTMLTVRHWARDGFLKNYLLFIPSGYHPNIAILDYPEFRFLADGLKTGALIGIRLYYTHYPSGYLVPHGVLAALGADSRVWFRALALLFSYGSVLWLAGFIHLIAGRRWWITILAVFYYTTSTTFLGYADSLANIPVDDFFKFAILFLSVYAIEQSQFRQIEGKWKKGIWALYFLLAISSYDSTFFIFAWLCAWDWWRNRKFHWKEYLVWASAPIAAFVTQILQNAWYLGWRDMFLDLWGAFAFRASQAPAVLDSLPMGVKNIVAALSTIGYLTDIRTRFIIPLLLIIMFLIYRWKIIDRARLIIISILLFSGLLYTAMVPIVGTFGYQGRQVTPAIVLLIALLTVEWKSFSLPRMQRLLIGFLVVILWAGHFQGTFRYARGWPNNVMEKEKIEYWKNINRITTPDTIIMGTFTGIEGGSHRFFQQVYMDRLLLVFKKPEDVVQYLFKIAQAAPEAQFLIISAAQEYGDITRAFNASDIPYVMENLPPLKDGFKFFTITP